MTIIKVRIAIAATRPPNINTIRRGKSRWVGRATMPMAEPTKRMV
jgi:hypothetical protein